MIHGASVDGCPLPGRVTWTVYQLISKPFIAAQNLQSLFMTSPLCKVPSRKADFAKSLFCQVKLARQPVKPAKPIERSQNPCIRPMTLASCRTPLREAGSAKTCLCQASLICWLSSAQLRRWCQLWLTCTRGTSFMEMCGAPTSCCAAAQPVQEA